MASDGAPLLAHFASSVKSAHAHVAITRFWGWFGTVSDGTEPSHMHTRDDLSCTRGYEMWLLREAKRRNPGILTYALSWGVPGEARAVVGVARRVKRVHARARAT